MASEVDVCNMALSHFGSETVVTSISPPDGSVEAGHCKRFFASARQQALEIGAPSWAKKRVSLAEVDNPSTVWAYAYALPSDYLKGLRVLQQATVQEYLYWPSGAVVTADDLRIFSERGSADFEVEDGVLMTHEPEAVLLYLRDVSDLTKWNATSVMGLSYLLASLIAGPLVKGAEGVKAGRELRAAARSVLTEGLVHDANSSSERNDFIPDHLLVR